MHTTAVMGEEEDGTCSPLQAYENPVGLFFTQHEFMQNPMWVLRCMVSGVLVT